jgi:hypothetical protein
MKTKLLMAAVAAGLLAATAAAASPQSTAEPRSKWLSEAAMKGKITQSGEYRDIKVFKVSGNCYEIYGHTKDGRRAEVYFNPVNGVPVEKNIDGQNSRQAGEEKHERKND